MLLPFFRAGAVAPQRGWGTARHQLVTRYTATQGITGRSHVRLRESIAKALPPLSFRLWLTQLGRPGALHQGKSAFRSPIWRGGKSCERPQRKLNTKLTLIRGADPAVPTASTSCALGAHGRTWMWGRRRFLVIVDVDAGVTTCIEITVIGCR
jgi:hypothetical protein